MPQQLQYTSFLLRIWRRNTVVAGRCTVVLEDTSSGERRVFASLAEALGFLETQHNTVLGAVPDIFFDDHDES